MGGVNPNGHLMRLKRLNPEKYRERQVAVDRLYIDLLTADAREPAVISRLERCPLCGRVDDAPADR